MYVQTHSHAKTVARSLSFRTVLSAAAMIGVFIVVLWAGACKNSPDDIETAPDWYVPDDFGTIQAAINNAAAGEIILVRSGTYSEAISLKDGVTLLGEDRDTTIIKSSWGDAVVSSAGCGDDTVIDGFTIDKGAGMMAGGMYNDNSSVTVRNCSFTANRADEGGGMHNSGGSPTIENCVFNGNTGIGTYNSGAGMYNVGSSPTISGCIFENNVAAKGSYNWTGRGGGIYNEDCANVTIDGCVFQGNRAGDDSSNYGFGYGCGMYNENSTVTLTDCAFMYNRDAYSSGLPTTPGGGIYNASGTDCTLINCVFVANSSSYGTLNGSSGSTSTLYNCTFCSNEAIAGILYIAGTLTVYNSILWDNNFCDYPTDPARIVRNEGGTITITYSNVEGGYSGTGNIDADPQFVTYPSYEPNTPGELATSWYTSTSQDFGNLRLLSGSPCIDTGNNSDVPSGTATDIDGRPRILDGPDPDSTAIVDMGAYEY